MYNTWIPIFSDLIKMCAICQSANWDSMSSGYRNCKGNKSIPISAEPENYCPCRYLIPQYGHNHGIQMSWQDDLILTWCKIKSTEIDIIIILIITAHADQAATMWRCWQMLLIVPVTQSVTHLLNSDNHNSFCIRGWSSMTRWRLGTRLGGGGGGGEGEKMGREITKRLRKWRVKKLWYW